MYGLSKKDGRKERSDGVKVQKDQRWPTLESNQQPNGAANGGEPTRGCLEHCSQMHHRTAG